METHPDLLRLVALLESYEVALEELRSLGDPGVERLIAELETMRARAALDLVTHHRLEDADALRAGR